MSAETKYQDAALKHQQKVQQHLSSQASKDDYESSSEEEELNEDDIMSKTLCSYHGTGAGGTVNIYIFACIHFREFA